jgi:hypothetical protein
MQQASAPWLKLKMYDKANGTAMLIEEYTAALVGEDRRLRSRRNANACLQDLTPHSCSFNRDDRQ